MTSRSSDVEAGLRKLVKSTQNSFPLLRLPSIQDASTVLQTERRRQGFILMNDGGPEVLQLQEEPPSFYRPHTKRVDILYARSEGPCGKAKVLPTSSVISKRSEIRPTPSFLFMAPRYLDEHLSLFSSVSNFRIYLSSFNFLRYSFSLLIRGVLKFAP